MTVSMILPAPPEPHLEPGRLPADFYAYEELLSDREREKVERLRDFLRSQVAPIVDDYWARAEFPFDLVKGFATLGLMDWADPDSSEQRRSNLLSGITALEMAHADPSVATFFLATTPRTSCARRSSFASMMMRPCRSCAAWSLTAARQASNG